MTYYQNHQNNLRLQIVINLFLNTFGQLIKSFIYTLYTLFGMIHKTTAVACLVSDVDILGRAVDTWLVSACVRNVWSAWETDVPGGASIARL